MSRRKMAEIIEREKSQAGTRERPRERVSSERRGVAEVREQMLKEGFIEFCSVKCHVNLPLWNHQ